MKCGYLSGRGAIWLKTRADKIIPRIVLEVMYCMWHSSMMHRFWKRCHPRITCMGHTKTIAIKPLMQPDKPMLFMSCPIGVDVILLMMW